MKTIYDLVLLARKIESLDSKVARDAQNCAAMYDFAGLAYIANMAMGVPGPSNLLLTDVMDLADIIRGVTPKLITGMSR